MSPAREVGPGRWRGRWTPEDRAASVWPTLPFEVGDGCPGLRVTLEHDRSHGSSGVVDLGLVDPLGWRGWSGGARSVLEVAPRGATPGYLDRGLPPGTWEVVLGLHRLPPEGLEVEVTVEQVVVEPPPQAPPGPPTERPPRRRLPAPAGLRWLATDLHAHSVHSDGVLTLDALAALAVSQGLDALWVTDHNTVSHHPHLEEVGARHGIRLLPGQEVTTADGHANALGDVGWVDFRRPAREWADHARGAGGLLSLNHPVAGDCAWRDPGGPLGGPPDLAEVWHGPWADPTHGGPLAWWAAAGQPVPVGGSDVHDPREQLPGTPTTWVLTEDDDVLGGLAAGRTAVSAGTAAPVLLRLGDELHTLGADGTQLVCADGRRTPVRGDRVVVTGHDGPHLLERDDRTLVALSS
ncbi:CehA/McbA family metallohydrolase [Phycicoccus sonneratiae]|uniref:CehA/McbA family metallohydrolase n=1 Tax=Phycicoccus sonneratiae TaxID=2807628 RepID=A0ABS2CQP6_9MICO|nr:CehA/McbA family metallohydrolase [Phycicoccus sonneraticus]MBM6402216.1 CehA/McbA family metallohydrolase [Phycicoccus sonneraticus]